MNVPSRVLILSTVWPEPSSSAAGVRQMQWIHFFLSQGHEIYLSSPSKMKNEEDWGSLSALGLPESVKLLPLPLNQSHVIEQLKALAPQIVMFDRFIIEEQFGHFIYQACPNALVLLETEDLHFIRRARDTIKEKYLAVEASSSLPAHFYRTETALRETASILRVDYSFVVSSFEEKLLREEFAIDASKVKWIPFGYDPPVLNGLAPFSEREGFCWIGNFRHAPNIDGLRWFRAEIWPLIRKRLPGARLKIYGAYPTEEVMQWHQPLQGVEVKGSAEDLDSVFKSTRVNLAPLRFGAGIKGKILEGFRRGVPCVTTRVGVEGIVAIGESNFGALEVNTAVEFAEACVFLHEDEKAWTTKRDLGFQTLNEVHSQAVIQTSIEDLLKSLKQKKALGEFPVWQTKILRHELVNSHKYFSKWIEEKERKFHLGCKH